MKISRRDCGKGLLGIAALAYGSVQAGTEEMQFRRKAWGIASVISPTAISAGGRTACR